MSLRHPLLSLQAFVINSVTVMTLLQLAARVLLNQRVTRRNTFLRTTKKEEKEKMTQEKGFDYI